MTDMDALLKAYSRFVALPWASNLAPPQRVWLVIYQPSDERRLRARVAAFAVATSQAEKSWKLVDVTDGFAEWLSSHPYRDTYFKQPAMLSAAALRDYEKSVVSQVITQAGSAINDPEAVVAVLGAGSLFPFTKVSKLIETLAPQVAGRLVIFFPGDRDGSNYRLLEARDGWNYLATPITASEGTS